MYNCSLGFVLYNIFFSVWLEGQMWLLTPFFAFSKIGHPSSIFLKSHFTVIISLQCCFSFINEGFEHGVVQKTRGPNSEIGALDFSKYGQWSCKSKTTRFPYHAWQHCLCGWRGRGTYLLSTLHQPHSLTSGDEHLYSRAVLLYFLPDIGLLISDS